MTAATGQSQTSIERLGFGIDAPALSQVFAGPETKHWHVEGNKETKGQIRTEDDSRDAAPGLGPAVGGGAAARSKLGLASQAHANARGGRRFPSPRTLLKRLITLVSLLLLVGTSFALVLGMTSLADVWRKHGLAQPCPGGTGTWAEEILAQQVTTLAFLMSLLPLPGALWLTVSSSTMQLRSAALLAVANWTFRVTRLLDELADFCCPMRGQSNVAPLPYTIEWVIIVRETCYFCIVFGCILLVHSRLSVVEVNSGESFGNSCASRLIFGTLPLVFLLWVLWYSVLSEPVNSPAAGWTVAGASMIWLLCGCSALIRGLLLIQARTTCAIQSPHTEVAAAARLTARVLRAQSRSAILSLFFSILEFWAFQAEQGLRPDPSCRDSVPSLIFRIFTCLIYDLDCAAVIFFTLSLSGATSGAIRGTSARRAADHSRRARWKKASEEWRQQHSQSPGAEVAAWEEAVHELAGRAVTLDALLSFYQDDLPKYMPDYDPLQHTTLDVVRRAIIPMSSVQRTSASALMMGGRYTRPNRLVTHTWSGRFHDLVSAAASDALGEPSYALISQLLARDPGLLSSWLAERGLGGRTFWICAFAVNQHLGICGSNPRGHKDPVTGLLHPSCCCGLPKARSDTPPLLPDGRSIPCEMNKFDSLMRYLSATDGDFRQVVAIDASLDIFTRAWCIAEMATAREGGMRQHLRVPSADIIDAKRDQLHDLKIQDMHASRPEDKRRILDGIPDVDEFNRALHRMLFHELIPNWTSLDVEEQMVHAGRVIRWQKTLHGMN